MSVKSIYSDENKELLHLTKSFISKLVQILVQSRLGSKAHTQYGDPKKGSGYHGYVRF